MCLAADTGKAAGTWRALQIAPFFPARRRVRVAIFCKTQSPQGPGPTRVCCLAPAEAAWAQASQHAGGLGRATRIWIAPLAQAPRSVSSGDGAHPARTLSAQKRLFAGPFFSPRFLGKGPGGCRSGQVRFITQPKSQARTMRLGATTWHKALSFCHLLGVMIQQSGQSQPQTSRKTKTVCCKQPACS